MIDGRQSSERPIHEDQSAQPAPARGPEELAIAADELDEVGAALRKLTPEQRDVIAYRFFAGLSPAEIGLIMGSARAPFERSSSVPSALFGAT
jgi:DNA-directed RNA polymerase specialized sigma24 family protein